MFWKFIWKVGWNFKCRWFLWYTFNMKLEKLEVCFYNILEAGRLFVELTLWDSRVYFEICVLLFSLLLFFLQIEIIKMNKYLLNFILIFVFFFQILVRAFDCKHQSWQVTKALISESSSLWAKVNAPVPTTTTMTTSSPASWSTPGDYSSVTGSVPDDYACRAALYFEIPGTK